MSLFNWQAPDTLAESRPAIATYQLNPSDLLRSRRDKVRGNLQAIQTLRALGDGVPTPEQQRDLARYQGWGLCADVFLSPPPAEWRAEAEQLARLLTPEEYAIARNSVNTAFYTPPRLIQYMFRLLQHLGFEGGTLLEPGCGSGLYMGLTPEDMTIQWSGVEMDTLAASIATQLYPDATIYSQPMERVRLPFDHFDGALGNVPYSAQPPYDPLFREWSLTGIHDYFIAKTVRSLRPGGIFPLLTSVGTLQSRKGEAFREQLAQWARLVCAFKLPMGTFSQFSFTEAACDLLVLQRLHPAAVGNGHAWVGVVDSPILNPETEAPLSINQVFVEHPDWVLGTLTVDRMYGGVRLGVKPEGNLYEQLEQGLEALPSGVYCPKVVEAAIEPGELSDVIPLPPDLQQIKPYSYLWYAEDPWQCREGRLHRVQVKGKQRLRLRYLIMIRDALNTVLQVQWETDDDTQLKQAQQRLDQVYRQYVVNHGWLHEAGNSIFHSDPDYPLLLALEIWNPDDPSQTKQADIFTQRTVRYIPPHTEAENAVEALVYTLAECGRVDLDYLQSLYPHPLNDIIQELQPENGPLIFHDPVLQQWVPAEAYLSGDVRQKLREADAAAKESPSFLVNVTALKAVQPVDLEPKQIFARLGTPWLPTDVIEAFIAHLLQITPNDKAFDAKRVKTINVSHSVRTASWTVNLSGVRDNILNTSEYGTGRVSAVRLIELALNQQIPEVYDYFKDTQVKNRLETRRALVKQEKVKEAFRRWVWSDWRRAERLCDLYNREYNCFRRRRFNGQHLKGYLKGVSTQWRERLEDPKRAYQLNQIWRGITDGNMLSKVPTGGGKTAIAICILQELKRHRQCSKPALVVMDQLVLQQAAEAAQIYPGLQVLTISSRNINSPQKRQEMIARAATGNWDLVVISHTAFKMMPLKARTISQITNGELELVRSEYREKGLDGKRGMKQLEKKTDKAQSKLDANFDIARDTVYLEDTGIDYVAYDELQETLLGLETETEMRGVLGISNANSDIARDFYYKTRYLAGLHGEGKGVILLSATPVRNTLGQAWTNLVYLCPKRLEARGLRPFDGFISAFSEPRVGVEITAAGTMEIKTRLASWSNFTEFKQLWWSVVDVVREEELDINKPRATYHMAEVPASPSQLAFFEHIVGRANQVRERLVDTKTDNYPKITSDVKRGVIHPLLLRPSELRLFLDAETIANLKHEHTKVSQAIEDTYQEWLRYKEQRLTQLLFLDSGTPNKEGRFTAYALIKEELIALGVPAEEIAYAHDAHTDEQKADLFRRFRQGLVRVLIGSTKRLGVGSHFPDRLRVVRCIDVPMRPADILQRIGRMVRPGNQNSDVEVWNYLTIGKPYTTAEGTVAGLSPDAYFFNVVQTKARFIDAMDEENEERTVQDIDEVGSLNFGLLVATASGDPRFKRKVELDTQVERLLSEEQDWQTQRIFLERRIHNLQQQVESNQKALATAQDAASQVVSTQGKQFKLTLTRNGKTRTYTKRETAGEVLLQLADQCRQQNSEDVVWVGELSGFAVGVNGELDSDRFTLFLDTPLRTYLAYAATPLGACRSLEDKLKAVLSEPADIQAALERDQAELTRSLDLQAAPFAIEDELKTVLAEQEALNRDLGIKEEEPLDAVAAA